jgi:hypothetical protein
VIDRIRVLPRTSLDYSLNCFPLADLSLFLHLLSNQARQAVRAQCGEARKRLDQRVLQALQRKCQGEAEMVRPLGGEDPRRKHLETQSVSFLFLYFSVLVL